MSALETLRRLAEGKRPGDGLLHTARLFAFGIEAYGEEAIVETFRLAVPGGLADDALVVAAPGHLAIFDADTAIFADLSAELVARIWRLGNGMPLPGERGVSVSFDPDLAQSRGDVFVAASDHPGLAPDAMTRVEDAARSFTDGDTASARTRVFVIRAFGTVGDGAALFAAHCLTGQTSRNAGFSYAAAHWSSGGTRLVRDLAGEAAAWRRPWTPRIG